MAFEVRLYSFAKKTNSTKRPDASGGAVFNVTYYGEYDLLSPALVFSFADNTTNPHLYNYVYIPSNDRYYYIDRWVYNNRFWIARCSVDALASWKDTIGSSTQFVERSASTSNPHIPDYNYPTSAKLSPTMTNPNSYPFVTSMAAGSFIVGVMGKHADPSAGEGVSWYYVLDSANFREFQKQLFEDVSDNGLAKRMQFITSCRWFPVSPSSISTITNTVIYFPEGGSITLSSAPVMISSAYPKTVSMDFVLPNHPQQTTYGAFMNYTHTQRELQWPPIGVVPLDVSKLSDMVSLEDSRVPLRLEIDMDLHTGSGFFRVLSSGLVVTNGGAAVCVEMPIATRETDITNTMGNSVSGIFSAIGGNLQGIVSSIGGILQSFRPQLRVNGTLNSAAAFLSTRPVVRSDFSVIVAQDNERFGKPYMETTKIGYLSGYIKCANGEFSSAYATRTEIDEINNYLNGGFYYE